MTRARDQRISCMVALGCLVLCVFLVGCGGSRKANVKGRISYNGRLVTGGTLTMVGPDQRPVSSHIDANGMFSIEGVAAGQVQVGVHTPEFVASPGIGPRSSGRTKEGPAPVAPEPPAVSQILVPKGFWNVDTSGVVITVPAGDSNQDIDLPPSPAQP